MEDSSSNSSSAREDVVYTLPCGEMKRDHTEEEDENEEKKGGDERTIKRDTDKDDSQQHEEQEEEEDTFVGLDLVTFEHVLELIPTNEKQAYLEAQRRCPELVTTESDPTDFLVRDDYNVWAAARRLVSYWEARMEIFGPERAFLPLDPPTGHGALNEDDIAILETGFYSFLPRDSEGRAVLCLDMSRARNLLSSSSRFDISLARVGFYMRSKLAHEEISQKEGLVGINIFSSLVNNTVTGSKTLQRYIGTLLHCTPVRTKVVYMVNVTKVNYFQQVAPMQQSFMNKHHQHRHIPITSNSTDELLQKLETYHFSKHCLPSTLGGTWSYDYFFHWLSLQQEGCMDTTTDPDLSSYLQSYCFSKALPDSVAAVSATAQQLDELNIGHNHHHKKTDQQRRPVVSMTTLLSDFYEALDMIPFEQKTAYIEAMQCSPVLVQEESNPKWFLLCEKNNPWMAARRCVNFWDYRKTVFGQQAFLRPLTTISNEVLTDEEKELVQSSAARFLPNDCQGRSVVWYDRSKRTGTAQERASRMRCWFYTASIVFRQESAQCNGVTLICVFGAEFFKQAWVASMADDLKKLVEQALPIRDVQIHVVYQRNDDLSMSAAERGLSLMVERYGRDTNVHVATSQSDLLAKLEKDVGLNNKSIPVEFGGTWTEQDDATWRHDNMRCEQERLETYNKSLTPTLSRKLFGRFKVLGASSLTHSNVTTESKNMIELLQKAIDALPEEAKTDYFCAMKTCPQLVETESNPELFLSFEGNDCIAAARRIVDYWTKRREIFGERAFLPMNLSPSGAMTVDDIKALHKGAVIPLPADTQGYKVLWMGSCSQLDLPQEVFLRMLFYVLHSITQDSNSTQDMGFVLLHVLSSTTHSDLHIIDQLLQGAFPARIAAVHLLCICSKSESTGLPTNVLLPAVLQSLSKQFLDNSFVHVSQNEDGMCGRLQWCGFKKEGLPTSVGGSIELADMSAIQATFSALNKPPSSTPVQDNDAFVSNGLTVNNAAGNATSGLDETIRVLPESEKHAYLVAVSKIPELVAKESKESWYLMHDNNVWVASRRLVSYWKLRVDVFGDRAMLPLHITGEGAVSREAVAYLSTGALVFLPEDNNGRTVLYYDVARAEVPKLNTLLEVMFYSAYVCSQNNVSPTEGVVMLLRIPTKEMAKDELLAQMLDVVQVFPFTWHSIHIITQESKGTSQTNDPWSLGILGPSISREKVFVHWCDSNQDILDKLAGHGIEQSGIPETLGGNWSYSNHARWQEQRVRIEWDLPSSCISFKSTGKRTRELSETEKAERKRRSNVLHSRRKRQRDRVEAEVLKSQADELEKSNESVRQENDHLQHLIEAANIEIARAGEAIMLQQEQHHDSLKDAAVDNMSALPIDDSMTHGRLPPFNPSMPSVPYAQMPAKSMSTGRLEQGRGGYQSYTLPTWAQPQEPIIGTTVNPMADPRYIEQGQNGHQLHFISEAPRHSNAVYSIPGFPSNNSYTQLGQSLQQLRPLSTGTQSQGPFQGLNLFSADQYHTDGSWQFQNNIEPLPSSTFEESGQWHRLLPETLPQNPLVYLGVNPSMRSVPGDAVPRNTQCKELSTIPFEGAFGLQETIMADRLAAIVANHTRAQGTQHNAPQTDNNSKPWHWQER